MVKKPCILGYGHAWHPLPLLDRSPPPSGRTEELEPSKNSTKGIRIPMLNRMAVLTFTLTACSLGFIGPVAADTDIQTSSPTENTPWSYGPWETYGNSMEFYNEDPVATIPGTDTTAK